MSRSMAFTLVLAGLSGCYHPTGKFISVDSYAYDEPPEYVIAVGDVLQVTVFQQEAMSARVRVRPDGRITLPLVNECVAAGKLTRALAIELESKMKDYVNKPSVRVSLEERIPTSVSIIGEVARPGTIVLDGNAGVLQALSAAGGFTDFAHRDGIFVVRTSAITNQSTRVHFTWDRLVAGEGRAARFRLMAGDVIVVE